MLGGAPAIEHGDAQSFGRIGHEKLLKQPDPVCRAADANLFRRVPSSGTPFHRH
jgi:hypothetical protein